MDTRVYPAATAPLPQPAAAYATPSSFATSSSFAPLAPAAYAPPNQTRRPLPLPWAGRTWAEYLYLTVHFFLAPVAFTYAVLAPSLAAGLLATVIGLFAAGGLVLGARGWGAMYRGLDRGLLRSDVLAPPAYVSPRGFWRRLAAMLFDPTGWRAILYMVVSLPLSIISWTISTVFLFGGLGGLTYWFWRPWLPAQLMPDGTYHRGFSIMWGQCDAAGYVPPGGMFPSGSGGPDCFYWFADTPGRIALVALAGLVLLALWAPITRGFARLWALLGAGLLGATIGSIRVAQLRQQRRAVVVDNDARLRQIERDLHDGTQARLTLVGMQLGEAQELLASGADPALAADLVANAHASTKDAIVELRDIARGIHPPALDAGLATALQTLAARSPIPVELFLNDDDAATGRKIEANPAVMSTAYYAIAELVNNAAKYSGANSVEVSVASRQHPQTGLGEMLITVTDAGRGGAVISGGTPGVGGTGLAGIATRVAALDGTFTLESPAGAGTTARLTLPTQTVGG